MRSSSLLKHQGADNKSRTASWWHFGACEHASRGIDMATVEKTRMTRMTTMIHHDSIRWRMMNTHKSRKDVKGWEGWEYQSSLTIAIGLLPWPGLPEVVVANPLARKKGLYATRCFTFLSFMIILYNIYKSYYVILWSFMCVLILTAHFLHGSWDLHGGSFVEASAESSRVITVSRTLGGTPRKPRQCKVEGTNNGTHLIFPARCCQMCSVTTTRQWQLKDVEGILFTTITRPDAQQHGRIMSGCYLYHSMHAWLPSLTKTYRRHL